jgi:hypothetical protein
MFVPADVQRNTNCLAGTFGFLLSHRSCDFLPRGFPSHHVQTASPALNVVGRHINLPAGDDASSHGANAVGLISVGAAIFKQISGIYRE